MNEVFKNAVKDRITKAIDTEGLSNKAAAARIGIPDNYLSMIKNPDMWPKLPAKAWDAALKWVNSGQSLKSYTIKKESTPSKLCIDLEINIVVNGKKIDRNYIRHSELQSGGRLKFDMQNSPDKTRGTSEESYPFSMSRE